MLGRHVIFFNHEQQTELILFLNLESNFSASSSFQRQYLVVTEMFS
jgi:hypothetical protein